MVRGVTSEAEVLVLKRKHHYNNKVTDLNLKPNNGPRILDNLKNKGNCRSSTEALNNYE